MYIDNSLLLATATKTFHSMKRGINDILVSNELTTNKIEVMESLLYDMYLVRILKLLCVLKHRQWILTHKSAVLHTNAIVPMGEM